MPKYIELDAAKQLLMDNYDYAGAQSLEFVPAADVVEVKRGRWETVGVGITERVRCSYCESTKGSFGKPSYCCECGAQMYSEVGLV